MYGRAIKLVTNKNVHHSAAIRLKAYHSSYYSFSSMSTHRNKKDSNYVDDIRKSASGLPSAASTDNRVNVVKTATTPLSDDHVNVVDTSTFPPTSVPPSSAYDRRHEDDRDSSSFVADAAKHGVKKALETGLEIGEMAKNTLDGVYNATKDTTHMVKEAVTGDDRKNNDVPPTDRFVDDMRKHADGYDLKNQNK